MILILRCLVKYTIKPLIRPFELRLSHVRVSICLTYSYFLLIIAHIKPHFSSMIQVIESSFNLCFICFYFSDKASAYNIWFLYQAAYQRRLWCDVLSPQPSHKAIWKTWIPKTGRNTAESLLFLKYFLEIRLLRVWVLRLNTFVLFPHSLSIFIENTSGKNWSKVISITLKYMFSQKLHQFFEPTTKL